MMEDPKPQDPRRDELTQLALDYAKLDRDPEPDRFYQSVQVGGLGIATVASARALPQLGVVMVLTCLGILAAKGIDIYYNDRRRWGELALVSTVLIGLTTLGFADRIALAFKQNDNVKPSTPRIEFARD